MKQNLIYLLALLLILPGCAQDKNSEIDDLQPNKTYYLQRKLTTITSTNNNKRIIDLNYSYNPKNQLINITGINPNTSVPVNIVLTYDDQNRLVHLQNTPTLSWTYTYNNKNQLEKQLRTSIQPDGTKNYHYYKLVYNTENKLTEAQIFNTVNNKDVLSGMYNYIYKNGQVSNIRSTLENGDFYREYRYTYDNNATPLAGLSLLSVPKYVIPDLPGSGLTTHNIISHIMIDETGQKRLNACFSANYIYNEAGYPIEGTNVYEDGTVEHTVYSYLIK